MNFAGFMCLLACFSHLVVRLRILSWTPSWSIACSSAYPLNWRVVANWIRSKGLKKDIDHTQLQEDISQYIDLPSYCKLTLLKLASHTIDAYVYQQSSTKYFWLDYNITYYSYENNSWTHVFIYVLPRTGCLERN